MQHLGLPEAVAHNRPEQDIPLVETLDIHLGAVHCQGIPLPVVEAHQDNLHQQVAHQDSHLKEERRFRLDILPIYIKIWDKLI